MGRYVKERVSVGILAGTSILLSCVQLAWVFYGILLYNCTLFISSTMHWWSVIDMMHLIYFWNPSCRPEVSIFSRNDYLGLHFDNEVNHIARSTHVWMIGYTAANILLIILSILVISAACCARTTKRRFAIYCPWIALSAFKLLMEIASTVYYSFDISRLDTTRDILQFIDATLINKITGNPTPNDFDENISPFRVKLPSILMMIASNQFFIFWIVNLIIVIYVIKFTIGLSKASTGKIPIKPAASPKNEATTREGTETPTQTVETIPRDSANEPRTQEAAHQRNGEPISYIRPGEHSSNVHRPTSDIRRYDEAIQHIPRRQNNLYPEISQGARSDDREFELKEVYPSQHRNYGFVYHPDIHQEPPQYEPSPVYRPSAPIDSKSNLDG